jgi:biotin carboxyl carrier protein
MPSTLTYADVHKVLALLRGWGEGTVSLRHDGLEVDVVMAATEPDVGRHLTVRSPAVGVFKPSAAIGAMLAAGEAIGCVEAPGRSTPIAAPAAGKLMQLAVPEFGFVEYDQKLGSLEPTAQD